MNSDSISLYVGEVKKGLQQNDLTTMRLARCAIFLLGMALEKRVLKLVYTVRAGV